MRDRAMYYRQRDIELRRSAHRFQVVRVVDLAGFTYKYRVSDVAFERGERVFCDFCGQAGNEVGMVDCCHGNGYLICAGCLAKIGPVVKRGGADYLEGDDCPCHRKVAERLMGDKAENHG